MNNFKFELMAVDEIKHQVHKLDHDIVAFQVWAKLV
jgi:hypothetical protein